MRIALVRRAATTVLCLVTFAGSGIVATPIATADSDRIQEVSRSTFTLSPSEERVDVVVQLSLTSRQPDAA
jgi:hypothetical protein